MGLIPPPGLNNVKKNRRFGSGGRPLGKTGLAYHLPPLISMKFLEMKILEMKLASWCWPHHTTTTTIAEAFRIEASAQCNVH